MNRYGITEIFESLQGEGRNFGRRFVFVRFAECNLACPWCDTNLEHRFYVSLEELLEEISSFRSRRVILTGGEPTIAPGMDELVCELKKRGWYIAVETNGTNSVDDCPWLNFVDYIACSPKAEYPDLVRLKNANEVRVVASTPGTADFCRRMEETIKADDYYVSPCERDGSFDFETAKSALEALDGWALSVQLHKILGFR